MPRAWMVITSPGKPPPNSESTDARRSATVLLVSEMSRMPLGSTPESTRCLTFPTSVVVLPVPAAAITSWVSASSLRIEGVPPHDHDRTCSDHGPHIGASIKTVTVGCRSYRGATGWEGHGFGDAGTSRAGSHRPLLTADTTIS